MDHRLHRCGLLGQCEIDGETDCGVPLEDALRFGGVTSLDGYPGELARLRSAIGELQGSRKGHQNSTGNYRVPQHFPPVN